VVFEHRVGAGGDVQFPVNAVHIFADGIKADAQVLCNLFAAESFGQEREDWGALYHHFEPANHFSI
jgi:hypothetical protein